MSAPRKLGPGCHVQGGKVIFSAPEMLAHQGLPDTRANRLAVARAVALRARQLGYRLEVRDLCPHCMGCGKALVYQLRLNMALGPCPRCGGSGEVALAL